MIKRVWKKYMNYILIIVTGSMLLLLIFSNTIAFTTLADENAVNSSEGAEPESVDGVSLVAQDSGGDAGTAGDGAGGSGDVAITVEGSETGGAADANSNPDVVAGDNPEGGSNAGDGNSVAGKTDNVGDNEAPQLDGTGTEGADTEKAKTEGDSKKDTAEGEDNKTTVKKEGETEEETDDEKDKCICESLCTEEAFKEECPVCKEDYTKCGYLAEKEKEKKPCTCKTHCKEESIDTTCERCTEDYTKCECKEVCTCTKRCKNGKVDLNCPVCAKDILECIGPKEDYVAIIHYYIGGEAMDAEFITLDEALNGAKAVADEVHSDGDSNYVPVIEIQDELSVSSSLQVVNNCTFEIDMRGHKISLESGAEIDFGSSTVTLKDSTASSINYGGDNSRPGGITGSGSKIFTGSGNIKFVSGYYNISNGTVCSGFSDITVDGAYLINSAGYISDTSSNLYVNGGFFVYDSVFSEGCNGQVICPNNNVLAEMSVLIGGYEVRGYGLSTALFKVTLHLVGITDYYYSTFAEAFDAAEKMSMLNDGAKTIISINDPSITNVAISQTYRLYSNANGYSPVVQIDNINFTRGGNGEAVFDGTLFEVGAGELILNDCSINGYISESQVAVSSMITVDYGATLTLIGSTDIGTSITGNVALYGATAGDPAAGIYLRSGSIIKVNGNIVVHNNVSYSETANSDGGIEALRVNRNIYMDPDARIVVDGTLLKTEGFLIGVTMSTEDIDEEAVVGSLGTQLYNDLVAAGITVMDLSSFYLDTSAAYFMEYDFGDNTIKWSRGGALLPEAGVLRVEYILLFIGLIGFIFRAVEAANNERKEIVRYITIMSSICFVAGTCFGAYHFYDELQIVRSNNEIVESMELSEATNEAEEVSSLADNGSYQVTSVVDTSSFKAVEEPVVEKSIVPADGRDYIGIIEIEKFGIKLPVLSTYTDADMKTTPCVYNGSKENDNLVIVGHNYDSQFGDFNLLKNNENFTAKLTLLDGSEYVYESKLMENLEPDQIDEMLSGDWDMTLFTCSYSGEKRITIRFDLVR